MISVRVVYFSQKDKIRNRICLDFPSLSVKTLNKNRNHRPRIFETPCDRNVDSFSGHSQSVSSSPQRFSGDSLE